MASQAVWQIAKLVRDAAAFLHSDGVNRTLFLRAGKMMGWPE